MSCCMCEPVETVQSPDDDTHAVGTRPKWARERGLHTQCGPFFLSVGCKPGPSIGDRTRTRANVNVRPRPPVEPYTCHQPENHTNLYLPSHFLSPLLSLLSSRLSLFSHSSSLHSFFPLAASSRFFPFFFCSALLLQLFISFSSSSLSTRLVSSFFAHLRMSLCLQAIQATHTRPLSPSSSHFSLLSPLFFLPSSLVSLLTSLPSLRLSSLPLAFPSLSCFPSFLHLSLQSVISFSSFFFCPCVPKHPTTPS